MIEFAIETHIERHAPAVFRYATDPEKLHTWQTNTVSAVQEGDGPVRLGTRFREVHRAPGGRELESVVEVSEFERDRTFALRVVEGIPVHLRMTFEATGEVTDLVLAAHGRPAGALRLIQPLLQRTLKRQFADDCATLKSVLEASPPRQSAHDSAAKDL